MTPRVVFDLDEIDELNPEPAAFRVNGKVLLAGEVPHPKLIGIQRRAAASEAGLKSLKPQDVDALEDALNGMIDIVWDLFAPFTDWLPETRYWVHRVHGERVTVEPEGPAEERKNWRRVDFLSDVSPRKLLYLIQKGFEEQLRLGSMVPNGDAGDPDDPPVGAGSQPAGRKSTRH